MKWSEREIARNLYWNTFKGKHVVVVPNCHFPGSECDLMIVRNDMRLMEVEIKISRADLKADQHKDKWLKEWNYQTQGWPAAPRNQRERVEYPAKIWKHYYAIPKEIWADDLLAEISPKSGVILLKDNTYTPWLSIKRQAKPNPAATPISSSDLVRIAHSMSARMWKAYGELDEQKRFDEVTRETA